MTPLTEREKRIWDAAYGAALGADLVLRVRRSAEMPDIDELHRVGLWAEAKADQAVLAYRTLRTTPAGEHL